MRGFWKRIEAAFVAVAFAEEGDAETARRLAEPEREGAARPALRPRVVRHDDRPTPVRRGKVARLP